MMSQVYRYHMKRRIEELESLFELRHKADMRGIAMWRAENPEERHLTQPDHGEMVSWLLSQLQEAVGLLERINGLSNPLLAIDVVEIHRTRVGIQAFLARIRAGSGSKAT